MASNVFSTCEKHDYCVLENRWDGYSKHHHARKGRPLPAKPSKWHPFKRRRWVRQHT